MMHNPSPNVSLYNSNAKEEAGDASDVDSMDSNALVPENDNLEFSMENEIDEEEKSSIVANKQSFLPFRGVLSSNANEYLSILAVPRTAAKSSRSHRNNTVGLLLSSPPLLVMTGPRPHPARFPLPSPLSIYQSKLAAEHATAGRCPP